MNLGRALRGAVLALLLTGPVAFAFAASPRADPLELEDRDRALVAKETLKGRQVPGNKSKSSGTASSGKDCGNVDIGNDNDSKKGSSRIAERQKTVIVTGNVYNTANCKR